MTTPHGRSVENVPGEAGSSQKNERSTPTNLAPRIEDLAVGYFNKNYVRPGYFKVLEELNRGPGFEPLLQITVLCHGMAGIAHTNGSWRVMQGARYHYGRALKLTNECLQDSSRAGQDQTLVAVLLLSVFEASPMHPRQFEQYLNSPLENSLPDSSEYNSVAETYKRS